MPKTLRPPRDAEPEAIRKWAKSLGISLAEGLGGGHPLRRSAALGPYQVVDLFCGAGGLSTGFHIAGQTFPSFELIAAVDIDENAANTFAANLPVRPHIVDLLAATRTPSSIAAFVNSLRIDPKRPLIVVGGPPCQGFSAHRKREIDVDDDRNDLVVSYAKIVAALDPDVALFENVPEVMAERHWHRFAKMKRLLERAGYQVNAKIHNLAGFGVPQERYRTLVIASKHHIEMPEPFLSKGRYRTVRDAIGALPKISPGRPCASDPAHECTNHRASTIETIKKVPINGGTRPKGVGPRCLDKVDGYRDVYGRLYWDRPANTITAYARNPASGRYVHPEQHRGLSVREAALLQGFPINFVFTGPFDNQFEQIGNAVPPIFSAFLACHIFGELQVKTPRTRAKSAMHDVLPTSNSFSSGIAGRKKYATIA